MSADRNILRKALVIAGPRAEPDKVQHCKPAEEEGGGEAQLFPELQVVQYHLLVGGIQHSGLLQIFLHDVAARHKGIYKEMSAADDCTKNTYTLYCSSAPPP